MKKICITLLVLSIMMVAFALPCGADPEINIHISYYGPAWDINHDGITDAIDVSLLVVHYGEEGTSGWIREDINKNGAVDAFDVSYLVVNYGDTWLVP
jgi:hypothetical protein